MLLILKPAERHCSRWWHLSRSTLSNPVNYTEKAEFKNKFLQCFCHWMWHSSTSICPNNPNFCCTIICSVQEPSHLVNTLTICWNLTFNKGKKNYSKRRIPEWREDKPIWYLLLSTGTLNHSLTLIMQNFYFRATEGVRGWSWITNFNFEKLLLGQRDFLSL